MAAIPTDQAVTPQDAPATLSDGKVVAAGAVVNTTEAQKLHAEAVATKQDTSKDHLPSLHLQFEETNKNGVDTQTWRDHAGRVMATETKDQSGNDVTHTYNYDRQTGKLADEQITTADKDGHLSSVSRQYDPNTGNIKNSAHIDADGTVETKQYDQAGKVLADQIKLPDGHQISAVYDQNGRRISETSTNPNGSSEREEFDRQTHRLTSDETKDGHGHSEIKTFNADTGALTADRVITVDKDGRETYDRKTFDANGQIDSTYHKSQDGSVDDRRYTNGKLESEEIKDTSGRSKTNIYDGQGNRITEESHNPDGSAERKEYDPQTHKLTSDKTIDAHGKLDSKTFDPHTGQEISPQSGSGPKVESQNAAPGFEEKQGKNGEDIKIWHDASGKISSLDVKDKDGNETTRNYQYDKQSGNLVSEQITRTDKDSNSETTSLKFDAHTGNIQGSLSKSSDGSIDARKYNGAGQMVAEYEKDHDGNQKLSIFDAASQRELMVKSKDANGTREHREYDAHTHRLTKDVKVDAHGNGDYNTYDAHSGAQTSDTPIVSGRPESHRVSDSASQSKGYEETKGPQGEDVKTWHDQSGRVAARVITGTDGTQTSAAFKYDERTGHMTSEQDVMTDKNGDVSTTTRTYDGETGHLTNSVHMYSDGTMQARNYTDGKLNYEYDKESNGEVTKIKYDPQTQKRTHTETTYPDGRKDSRDYDPNTQALVQETSLDANGNGDSKTYDPQSGMQTSETPMINGQPVDAGATSMTNHQRAPLYSKAQPAAASSAT